MAERRMFAKTIVLSDAFLDLPMSARCLYFTLGMLADDDGFVNAPRSIMRQCGASDDDMKILLSKKFVLIFDSGVIVIKHWRINNYLRSDRYTETKYIDEKSSLTVDGNGAYHSGIPGGIPVSGIPSTGIPSIDKDSVGKNRKDKDSVGNSEGVIGGTNENDLFIDSQKEGTVYPEGKEDLTGERLKARKEELEARLKWMQKMHFDTTPILTIAKGEGIELEA